MHGISLRTIALAILLVTSQVAPLNAADWPMWRYDAGRSAAAPEQLPAELHLQWTRELPTPRPAFPGEIRLRYDATYEPVVVGKKMFVPSMVTDSVTALDTDTGADRWQCFADGAVRFAPAVWEGNVYFVSDDGHLYCVGADAGNLHWKFHGAPNGKTDRKIMGNGRLVSLYPARGGPVLNDGVVYFAAGIFSGDGVAVHALDARTGQPIWSNTDSNRIPQANMDHGVAYDAGISPQGYLTIVDNKLVVPCGTQLPAILDIKTGELQKYTMGWGGRIGLAKGCWFVAGVRNYLMHGGDLYDIQRPNDENFGKGGRNFKPMLYPAGLTRLQIDRTNQKGLGQFRRPVLTSEAMYYNDQGIVAYDLTQGSVEERAKPGNPEYRRKDEYPDKLRASFPELWRLPSTSTVHIKAGNRLYCGRSNTVEAVDIPSPGHKSRISWQAEIEGTPHSMLSADGKLFVVTREGRIYAFGPEKQAEPVVHAPPSPTGPKPDKWTAFTGDVLKMTETSEGYALVIGIGTGRLTEELVWQSKCNVIAVDPDPLKVERLRRKFQRAGLYGTRVTIFVIAPTSHPLPPYFASLIVSEDPGAIGDDLSRTTTEALMQYLRPYGGTLCLALPGDARRESVTAGSKLAGISAQEVGVLAVITRDGPLPESSDWSHNGANAANTGASQDRFVKAPLARLWFDGSLRWVRTKGSTIVRVAGGRIFVLAGKLYAIDVYTGRHLWQQELPARPTDDRMVAVDDAVYLANDRSCVVLDAATGETMREITVPEGVASPWSIIRVVGDSLVGACGNTVVCVNRSSGELTWRYDGQNRIGCLALGGGKVFCADYIKRRTHRTPDVAIQALDASAGKVLWKTIGGSDIRFCEPLDLLCTSSGSFRGNDGTRVGNAAISLIAGDKLISGGDDRIRILDPQSGANAGEELNWNRRGCTSLRGCANLLTTRFMGNAAYLDIATGQITSIWNVRAACSNNLFPANGILNAPNLTGGCTCNYMPISQAFVPAEVFEGLNNGEQK